jgi:hypothetical protein
MRLKVADDDGLDRPVYTLEQLAKLEGVSERWLRRQIELGHLVASKPSHKIVRVYRSEIRKWRERARTVAV